MRNTTAQQLRAVAPQILSGQYTDQTPFCPEMIKKAIAILNLLKDNQWHSATEIGESLDIGAKYARDVLRECADAWELERNRRLGWRLPIKIEVAEITDHRDYSDRKGRVWGVIVNDKIRATSATKQGAMEYAARLTED